MQLNQIECFIATYECGSFAEAARRLFQSPAAVSKNVRKIEQERNLALFVPNSSPLQPTDIGSAFYEQALLVVRAVKGLEGVAPKEAGVDLPEAAVAIASQPLRGAAIPRSPLALFVRQHPATNLDVMPLANGECLNALDAGIVDVAFAIGSGHFFGYESSEIWNYQPHVLMAADNPLATQARLSLEDLTGSTFAMPYDLGQYYPTMKERLGQRANMRFKYVELSPKAHCAFLNEGGLILVTPDPLVKQLFPETASLPLSDPWATIHVRIVTPTHNATPASRLLREHFLANKQSFSWGR